MKTPRRQIAKIIASRIQSPRFQTKRMSREVAAYLLETGRTRELESLLRDVVSVRAEHGIVETVAVSAHSLDAAARRDISRQVREQYPHTKEVIIAEQLDPNVLGGVRLEFPGRQLDLSVRSQLNRFKQLTAGE